MTARNRKFVHVIHERRVANYKEKRQRVYDNLVNCIPLPFKRFRTEFPGVEKGKYYLVTGNTKSAKTNFTNYVFVLQTLLYAMRNPGKIKVRILYFSLEMSVNQLMDRFMCWWIFTMTRGEYRTSTVELNSTNEMMPMRDSIMDLVEREETRAFFKFLEDHVDIITDERNPYGIYKFCKKYAEDHGTIHYKKIRWKNKTTGEMEEKEVVDFYEPDDPELYTLVITDHLGLLSTERGMSKRETLINYSSNHCVSLRNDFGMTIVNVMQQNADKQGNDSVKMGRLMPSVDGLAEAKAIANDCDMMIGIFNPWYFQQANWMGYDIRQWQDNIRFIEIILNREGSCGQVTALYFHGSSGIFLEIPQLETPDYIRFRDRFKPDHENQMEEQ